MRLTPNENKKQLKDLKQLCKGEISLLVEQMDDKSVRFPIGTIKYISHPDNILAEKANIIGSEKAEKLDSRNGFKKSEDGDVVIGPVEIKKVESKYGDGVELRRIITLPLPFPKWKWLTSDKIENNDQTKKELMTQYNYIWNSLHIKNIKILKPLFKERTGELAKAYYAPKKEMSIIPSLEDAVSDKNAELFGLYPKHMKLKVFGDGRLAKLVNDWYQDGTIIAFNYTNSQSHRNFDIIFRKQNGKWIITR